MTFTWPPTHSTSVAYTPKLNTAAFGDGYTQRSAKGLNNNPKAWSLTFDNVDDFVKESIRQFLKSVANNGGIFVWKDLDNETLNYTCTKFDITYTQEDDSSIKATFQQEFAPVTAFTTPPATT